MEKPRVCVQRKQRVVIVQATCAAFGAHLIQQRREYEIVVVAARVDLKVNTFQIQHAYVFYLDSVLSVVDQSEQSAWNTID